MTTRLTVALCAALAFGGQAFAQTPTGPPSAQPPAQPLNQPLTQPPAAVTDGSVPSLAVCCFDAPPAGPRCWVSADYLVAWMRGDNVPALITGSPPGTAQTAAGVLGQQGTQVLFGGTVNDNIRSGFRIGAGAWLGSQQVVGVEAGFMMLESQSTLFNATSGGNGILARPFTDATTGLPQAQLIAYPGLSNGSVAAQASSGNFYTFNFDVTEKVVDTGSFQLVSLLGYRYYRYDENLRVNQVMAPTSAAFIPGTQISSADNFSARNEFNGLDMGLRARFSWEQLSLTVLTRVAVGRVQRLENIAGSTTTSVPGFAPTTATGGLLALASNVGSHPNGDWAAMPELGLNLAWRVAPYLNLRVGYTVLFLDRVGRASDQIDTNVNPGLLPPASANLTGPNNPAFNFIRSDVWIQSLNFGVEFTF